MVEKLSKSRQAAFFVWGLGLFVLMSASPAKAQVLKPQELTFATIKDNKATLKKGYVAAKRGKQVIVTQSGTKDIAGTFNCECNAAGNCDVFFNGTIILCETDSSSPCQGTCRLTGTVKKGP
jgi:hypothetical protein